MRRISTNSFFEKAAGYSRAVVDDDYHLTSPARITSLFGSSGLTEQRIYPQSQFLAYCRFYILVNQNESFLGMRLYFPQKARAEGVQLPTPVATIFVITRQT